jgi:hypothetical protein
METEMKSYRAQALECDANGNRFEVEVPYLKKPNVILICRRYRTYCHSQACLQERIDKDELAKYF